jgi:hypothetical protein
MSEALGSRSYLCLVTTRRPVDVSMCINSDNWSFEIGRGDEGDLMGMIRLGRECLVWRFPFHFERYTYDEEVTP